MDLNFDQTTLVSRRYMAFDSFLHICKPLVEANGKFCGRTHAWSFQA